MEVVQVSQQFAKINSHNYELSPTLFWQEICACVRLGGGVEGGGGVGGDNKLVKKHYPQVLSKSEPVETSYDHTYLLCRCLNVLYRFFMLVFTTVF